MFPCGGTCLPVNDCWCFRVEERVYQWTIVNVSVWRNVSTSELLMMFLHMETSTIVHWWTRSSTRMHQQLFTGGHIPPHGYINNSILVDTFLHTCVRVEGRVYQWTIVDVSVWSKVSTSELLLMFPFGGTCLPLNYSHGYINNRSLVDTSLHTDTSTIVHW
jgi:hypothetical protein